MTKEDTKISLREYRYDRSPFRKYLTLCFMEEHMKENKEEIEKMLIENKND